MTTVSIKQFKEMVEKGLNPKVTICKQFVSSPEFIDRENCVSFVCSSEQIDRSNDVVFQNGIDFSDYMTNPVVFYNHETNKPPIAKCVEIGIKNKKLVATFEFLTNEVDYDEYGRKAHSIFTMIKNGFLNCVSIGITPKKFDRSDDPSRMNGYDFFTCRLYEISIVNIPANTDANVIAESIPTTDKSLTAFESPNLIPQELAEDEEEEKEIECEKPSKKKYSTKYAQLLINLELAEDDK
jgi:HK97 family phage prohead protease